MKYLKAELKQMLAQKLANKEKYKIWILTI